MKKIFLILFLFILFHNITTYEFLTYFVSGYNNQSAEISLYKNNVYYEIFTEKFPDSTTNVYLKYVIGDDEFHSDTVRVNSNNTTGRDGTIDTDTSGHCYIAWVETDTAYNYLKYGMCEDTTFQMNYYTILDSTFRGYSQLYSNVSIDVSDDQQFVGIAFNEVFYYIYNGIFYVDSAYILYTISTDSGKTFNTIQRLNASESTLLYPDITVSDSIIYISYINYTTTLGYTLEMANIDSPYESVDQTILTIDNSSYNLDPSIVAKKDTQFIVYESLNNNTGKLNIKFSIINNMTLFDSMTILPDTGEQRRPFIVLDSYDNPFITFEKSLGDGPGLYFSIFDPNLRLFTTDWVLGIGNSANFVCKSDVIFENDISYYNFYILSVYSSGTNKYSIVSSSKPDEAPQFPDYVAVNYDTTYNWITTDSVNILWNLPYDYSSIFKSFVKFHSRPMDNADTTFTIFDSTFTYKPLYDGVDTVFIWCMDYRGNVNYMNSNFGIIRYDKTPPTNPNKISPINMDTIYYRIFDIMYNKADDYCGIEHYQVGINRTTDVFSNSFNTTDTFITIDESYFTLPFSDGIYFWNVIAYDSAGNSSQNSIEETFYLKATPAVFLISPGDYDTSIRNISLIYSSISDYNSAVMSYRIQIASDETFNDLILDTVYGSSYTDTVFNTYISEDYDNIYWRVTWINDRGNQGDFNEYRRLFLTGSSSDLFVMDINYYPNPVNLGDTMYVFVSSDREDLELDNSYVYFDNGDTLHLDFTSQYSATFSTIGIEAQSFNIHVIGISQGDTVEKVSEDIYITKPNDWVDDDMLLVWPNPVSSDILHINTKVYKNSDIRIDIYDMKANKIREISGSILAGENKTFDIDIASLQQDLYFGVITYSADYEIKKTKFRFVKVR